MTVEDCHRESDSTTFVKYIKLVKLVSEEVVAEFRDASGERTFLSKQTLEDRIAGLIKDDQPHDESSYAMKYWPKGY